MSTPRFPNVEVELTSIDGNAGSIMGAVAKAIRKAGATPEEVSEYRTESLSGDYNHLVQTAIAWVEVS